MATQEDFDFESFKKEAIAGLYVSTRPTHLDLHLVMALLCLHEREK